MVCKGARWRVGDGLDRGGLILSPQHDSSLMVVKELLLLRTKVWNMELIDQKKFPWEAEGIKSIPASYI